MQSLAERLRLIRPPVAPPPPPARRPGLEAFLPGASLPTPAGECFHVHRAFPPEHRHGQTPLAATLELPGRALATLLRASRVAIPDWERVAFLDVETTGLAGGAGTFVFLVGVGRFESGRFVVRQFFMRDYPEEPALLCAVADLGPTVEAVVTFNGKTFDLPLLETRSIAARQPLGLAPRWHLDLLHPARRLVGHRLESCALATLERALLGHVRADDVPGWQIPSLYFAYLRQGAVAPLARVFEHNVADVLSLVALTAHLGRLVADPFAAAAGPGDLLAVARLAEDAGQVDDAAACYRAAYERADDGDLRCQAGLRLAYLYKRNGQADRALALWRQLAAAGRGSLAPYIELAKHHEHRRRDLASALEAVRQAMVVLELLELRHGTERLARERAELERRLSRLLRKRGMGVGG